MLKKLSIFVLLLAVSASSVSAQSLAEKIKARAAEIGELKALLSSPDPSVRIAAVDVMQSSDDLAMREMGYNAGINSSDEAVLALTIRNRFKEIKTFNIEMAVSGEVNEEGQKVVSEIGGRLGVIVKDYDANTASFKNSTTYSGNTYESSITGTVIQLNTRYCNGALALDDELFFSGKITCNKVRFDVKAQVF